MTGLPQALADHLAASATTTCHAWIVTRRDGVRLGFTDHDRTLAIEGVTCEPQSGMVAGETEASLGLSAETSEVAGALTSERISADDIAAGRYDGATVDHYLVNWAAADQRALLSRRIVGEIVRADEAFRVELRGLASRLDQPNGRHYRRRCDADLGDARCGVDVDVPAYRHLGVVAEASPGGRLRAEGLDGFETNWFSDGRIRLDSGMALGRIFGVRLHAGQWLHLETPWPEGVAAGDAFTLWAGCDKQFATCKAKFANQLNFRGFPHIPGNDEALAYAAQGVEHDGRPLVP